MVYLLEDFMYVEKSVDWKLHLQIVEHMIPFFCATGHFHYAKSTQVYLEDMTSLQLKMDPSESKKFSELGQLEEVRGFFWHLY